MPPLSDKERLKELRGTISDRGNVSQADAGSIVAMREKLTGERKDVSELASVTDAYAEIDELLEIVRDRDAENTMAAGNTKDDGEGSVELGTDAVHRAADQTANDQPTPNAPVDPEAAEEDRKAKEEGTAPRMSAEDTNPEDDPNAGEDSDADKAESNVDDAEASETDSDDEADMDADAESDADTSKTDADETKPKGKAKKAKAAKTSKKK